MQQQLQSSLEENGYKIHSFVKEDDSRMTIELKEPGNFGKDRSISIKEDADTFSFFGIEDDEQLQQIIKQDLAEIQRQMESQMKTETKNPDADVQTLPTNCTRCGAPLNVSQEYLVVTCNYCKLTIISGLLAKIRKHSMLENHLFVQQAVEAAQRYMDRGLFRTGVAKEAKIIRTKLRFVPFWVFEVDATTRFSGIAGAGISGEIHQAQEAISDKKSGKLSRFGKVLLAAVSAYSEMQQKGNHSRRVSDSFSSHYTWTVIARNVSISEITYFNIPITKKIPFDVGKVPEDAEFLNMELDEQEARDKTRAEVDAKERRHAASRVDSLYDCGCDIRLGDGELIHAPIWFVHYSLEGDNYQILVDGSEGKVLGGGRPIVKLF